MKIVFYLVLIFHAIFHLLGFFKAFNIAKLNEITSKISEFNGILWLLTSVSLIVTVALMLFEIDLWPVIAFSSVVLSQILIITTWKDSKYGTIINVLLLLIAIFGFAGINFKKNFKRDVQNTLTKEAPAKVSVLTLKDISALPDKVQEYVIYSGSIDRPKVLNFNLTFNGQIRKNNEAPWMPFVSEQYNFISSSSRLFFMDAEMKNLPVAGYHRFENGNAFMDIRLLSLFKVQYEEGKEMGIAETVTFFNDMCCMAPATLIDKRIEWLGQNGDSVFAKFTNNSISIKATLVFNAAHQLINFISEDRYTRTGDGTMKQIRWSTPLKNYRSYHGYNLPGFAETIYSYPSVDVLYGTFELKTIEYNVHSIFNSH